MLCNNIIVNDTVIEFLNSVKYFGVILENTLLWNEQINDVCKYSMRTLSQMKMNNEVFSEDIKIKLVQTLIFSIFDDCTVIYTNITQKSTM